MADQPGAEPRSEPKAPQSETNASHAETAPDKTPNNVLPDIKEPLIMPEQANGDVGVGDLHSTAKGSGARFNLGKPPMETIPVWIIAAAQPVYDFASPSREADEARGLLEMLGDWQSGAHDMLPVLNQMSLEAWEEAAQVFHHVTTRPVKPYPMWNWAKGMPWSVPTACAVRHLLAILRGEENDPETNLPHRGHAMCNLIMLAQYERTYPEGDDRPEFLRQSAVA